MRYLKYALYESLDQSVIDECKDILLELEDKGIKTSIDSYLNYRRHDLSGRDWISFHFTRSTRFNYTDIEDVVERLKSYLSDECGLSINWQNPKERRDKKPTIDSSKLMNPMNFEPRDNTKCELYFSKHRIDP